MRRPISRPLPTIPRPVLFTRSPTGLLATTRPVVVAAFATPLPTVLAAPPTVFAAPLILPRTLASATVGNTSECPSVMTVAVPSVSAAASIVDFRVAFMVVLLGVGSAKLSVHRAAARCVSFAVGVDREGSVALRGRRVSRKRVPAYARVDVGDSSLTLHKLVKHRDGGGNLSPPRRRH